MHRCCCELGPKSAQLLGMYSWDVGGGDGIGQHIVVTLGSAVVHLCLSSGDSLHLVTLRLTTALEVWTR